MNQSGTRLRIYAVTALALTVILSVLSCAGAPDNSAQIEQHKKLAGELHNNGLYKAAIGEYEKALDLGELNNTQRANLNYLIARIYFDNLSDYESAAAYYIKAREYDPNGSFVNEASKNLVASLERLGNVSDARRQLRAASDINDTVDHSEDVVVAKISDRPIYLSDIEERISALPPEQQKELTTPEAKRKFMRQYVGAELLYDAAVRDDYTSRPEIVRQQEQILKRLVIERYVTEKVMPEVHVDTSDVHNYYLANKDSLYDGKPYDSVKASVFFDYQSDKAQTAYNDYIAKLAKAEQVEFYDNRIK